MAAGVQGLERLLRQVEALTPEAAKAQSAVLEQSAYELADAIEAKAPRRSGATAHSVGYVAGPPPSGAGFLAGGTAVLNSEDGGEAADALTGKKLLFSVFAGGPEAYWVRWEEFGTRASTKGETIISAKGKARKAGRTHPGTHASPFFYPTIRARRTKIKSALRRGASAAAKAAAATK